MDLQAARRALTGVAFALCAVGSSAPARGEASADVLRKKKTCADVLAELEHGGGAEACETLALIGDTEFDRPRPVVEPRHVEPRPASTAGDRGIPGQTQAVNSLHTVGLAGAALSLVTVEEGSRALTAITLNPWGIATQNHAPDFTRASRFADVTFLIPFVLDDQLSSTQGSLDFFGVRARFNFVGISEGQRLLEEVRAAFDGVLVARGDYIDLLTKVLRTADARRTAGECWVALREDEAAVRGACGADSPTRIQVERARGLLESTLRGVRRRAERRAWYFGLDLAADIGSGISATTGTTTEGFALDAALAAGVHVSRNLELRGRLGLHTFSPDQGRTDFAIEGSAGLAFEPDLAGQKLSFSLGLQGRYDVDEGEGRRLQPSFVEFRSGLSVPIVRGAAIEVAAAMPVSEGDDSPKLTVALDWNVLLPSPEPE